MKGLLHSKRFRNNLYHWLIMYAGVLLLLTSVVTYSKYLSTFNSEDKARVAKFNIHFDNDSTNNEKCKSEKAEGLECEVGQYRPTSEIPILFTIETELEVTTKLTLDIYAKDGFKLKDLIEIPNAKENDGSITYYSYIDGKYHEISEPQENVNIARIRLEKTIQTTNGIKILKYQVTAKYKDDYQNFQSDEAHKAIEIKYSATQVTPKN
ncbi:MAG: hypothetical protein K2M17_05980 [Bacilli bacterium]|nr:hypothetical protein [Bacilli bacterium]